MTIDFIREEKFTGAQKEFLSEYCNYSKTNTIFLSFDIDWVPEYMLELVANMVTGLDVTFMHTHASEYSRKIKSEFQSGIHPNIMKNSDQGNNIKEVISFFKKLEIDFSTSRFHRLYHGYSDLIELAKVGTKLDSSTLLFNGKNIIPVYHADLDMILAPYFWEDGIYLSTKKYLKGNIIDWETRGLKIFDFHPLDIYLNSFSASHRNQFKNCISELQSTEEKIASKFINRSKFGIRDILRYILERHSTGFLQIKSLQTLNREFRNFML